MLLPLLVKFKNYETTARCETSSVSDQMSKNEFQKKKLKTSDGIECHLYWKIPCHVIRNQARTTSAKHLYLKPFSEPKYSHPKNVEIGNKVVRGAESCYKRKYR